MYQQKIQKNRRRNNLLIYDKLRNIVFSGRESESDKNF